MRTAERVSISAFVDPDDYERLVERARSEEPSTSAELRVAIREHLGESDPARDDRGDPSYAPNDSPAFYVTGAEEPVILVRADPASRDELEQKRAA
ncbi:MAG TPA: ribbon-helix-helix protein, CopG family, partial [Solirubrobacterales bacterium]|nr:ribbon-helix-helix protein, CopG family [Solirubrobacterales bacterium]